MFEYLCYILCFILDSRYPLNSQLIAICARNVPLEVTTLLAYEYLDITCDAYARVLHVRVPQRDDVTELLIKYITENNLTETEFKETLKKHTPSHRMRIDIIEKLEITPTLCKGLLSWLACMYTITVHSNAILQ